MPFTSKRNTRLSIASASTAAEALGTRLPCPVCVAIERSIVDQSAKSQEYLQSTLLWYLRLVILDACLPFFLSPLGTSLSNLTNPCFAHPLQATWSWALCTRHPAFTSIRTFLIFYTDSRRRGTSSIFYNSIEHRLTRAATAASTTSSRWATLSVG